MRSRSFFLSEKVEISCEISILNVSDLIAKKAKICISDYVSKFKKMYRLSRVLHRVRIEEVQDCLESVLRRKRTRRAGGFQYR